MCLGVDSLRSNLTRAFIDLWAVQELEDLEMTQVILGQQADTMY